MEDLMKTHFPESVITSNQEQEANEKDVVKENILTTRTKKLANKIFTQESIEWAISSFKLYKVLENDGLFPALIQRSIRDVRSALRIIYKVSLYHNHVPETWKGVRVVFIPKGGRPGLFPKSYRPISLTSFILKGMEKVLDQYLRNEVLTRTPLHYNQFAYQRTKSIKRLCTFW